MAASRCRTKPSSIGIGFSRQRVPSLSNTATRSAGGRNFGDPSVVTLATKSRMAATAGPSFHDLAAWSPLAVAIAHLQARPPGTPCTRRG